MYRELPSQLPQSLRDRIPVSIERIRRASALQIAGLLLTTSCTTPIVGGTPESPTEDIKQPIPATSPSVLSEQLPELTSSVPQEFSIFDISLWEKDRALKNNVSQWYERLLSTMKEPQEDFLQKSPSQRTKEDLNAYNESLKNIFVEIINEYISLRPEVSAITKLSPMPVGKVLLYLFKEYGYIVRPYEVMLEVEEVMMSFTGIEIAEIETTTHIHCTEGCSTDVHDDRINLAIRRFEERLRMYSLDSSIPHISHITLGITRPESGVGVMPLLPVYGFALPDDSLYVFSHKYGDRMTMETNVGKLRVEQLLAHEFSHAYLRNHFEAIRDVKNIAYEEQLLPSVSPVQLNEAVAVFHEVMEMDSQGNYIFLPLLWGYPGTTYNLAALLLENYIRDILIERANAGLDFSPPFREFIEGKQTFMEAFLATSATLGLEDTQQSHAIIMKELSTVIDSPAAKAARPVILGKHMKHLQDLYARFKVAAALKE